MMSINDEVTEQSRRARPRDVVALATLFLPLVVVLVTATLWWGDLPAELPRQWNADGISSASPAGVMFGVLLGLTLLAAIGAALAMPAGAAPNRRNIFLGSGFVAGLAGSIWVFSAGLTVLPGADPTAPGGWPLVTVIFGGYGALPYFLAHAWVYPARDDGPEPDAASVSADAEGARLAAAVNGRAEWTSSISSPLFTGLVVAAVALTLGIVVIPALADASRSLDAVLLSVIVFVTLSLVMFSRIRIRIDAHGLSVRSALLGLPLRIVPLSDIVEAHADYLEPLRWGGWGYRVTRGRSAVILRAGPGLVVTRRNGRLFAVSMTAPDVPAALLESLRTRA